MEFRIISKRELREVVLNSPPHIARLEAAGRFPKRVRLGHSRVGWVYRGVMEWLHELIARCDFLIDDKTTPSCRMAMTSVRRSPLGDSGHHRHSLDHARIVGG